MATVYFRFNPFRKRSVLTLLLGLVLFWFNTTYAQQAPSAVPSQPLHFVYIHGTNNNSEDAKRNFSLAVQQLHAQIQPRLANNPLFYHLTLHKGLYYVSPQPIAFFWGDRTKPALQVVEQQLLITRLLSPRFVQRLRQEIALTLHDAVWFEQTQNKKAVLALLYATIKEQIPASQPIVLMGHSAGSMIVFEFLLTRVSYINILQLMQVVSAPPALIEEASAMNLQPTCLEALEQANIFRFNATGHLVPFLRDVELPPGALPDEHAFKMQYFQDRLSKLNSYTHTLCLPQDNLKGVVLFGSPLTLFASSIFTPPADQNYFVGQLGKYFLEQNKFWLHVNHAKDPIAFPIREENLLQRLKDAAQDDITPQRGFITNYISQQRGTWLKSAHSWYWNKPDAFAQSILQAYVQGYTMWYPGLPPE